MINLRLWTSLQLNDITLYVRIGQQRTPSAITRLVIKPLFKLPDQSSFDDLKEIEADMIEDDE